MSEQGTEFHLEDEPEQDVEAHRVNAVAEEDDVEAHVQPPRDTDVERLNK